VLGVFKVLETFREEWIVARILIVDQSETIRRAYTDIVCAEGHSTSSCSRAEDVDVYLQHSGADVVVLNLDLQDVSGLEYLRRSKAQPRRATFIATCGGIPGRSIENALTLAELFGAVVSLVTPIVSEELIVAINQALASIAQTPTGAPDQLSAHSDPMRRMLRGAARSR